MFSIVVLQHKKISVIGIRLDDVYRDARGEKAYTTIEEAKQVFESKVKIIQKEEK